MFKIGDLVKGINKYYGVTNLDMHKAEVTHVYADGNINIKVLEHKYTDWIGSTFSDLDSEDFELIEEKKPEEIKIVTEGIIQYIIINEKTTLAIPALTPIGKAVKHEDDEHTEIIGKSLAQYRLLEKVNKMGVL
ncbi:TPA: hypothetical protein ACXNW8_001346 [Clostridium botulinum]|uniref:hypothetical protein n=1 Tax=Clostridium botulinum TaxID=1491 RepID=UPI001C9A31F1|nr:hypothetical protein [Clostridium botulinum]MBY6909548.1 hypothetical protein [Clostridium botulinum]